MHAASQRPINRYYESLHAIHQQGAITEGATRIAFQNLLSELSNLIFAQIDGNALRAEQDPEGGD